MRILIIHNRYLWDGGEDRSVEAESEILKQHGHEVEAKIVSNPSLWQGGGWRTAIALWRSHWSQKAFRDIATAAAAAKAEAVIAHNFWFSLPPAALAGAQACGAAVILTLHNFRLLCAAATLRDRYGRLCRLCLNGRTWPAVWRRCYRGSALASLLWLRMIRHNHRRRTWERHVDLFLVPSTFCRSVYAAAGFPIERFMIKSPPIADPLPDNVIPAAPPGMPRIFYAGRLAEEKGLFTLLSAWQQVESQTAAELRIAGDGQLRPVLQRQSAGRRVVFLGQISAAAVNREIAACSALVFPSECEETFGRTVVEAAALGRPAVVSRLGGQQEHIEDGSSGLLFTPGDAAELAQALLRLIREPRFRQALGQRARELYLAKYAPARNYALYAEALRRACE
ncbi:MAG: glycosyltransferase family 4 protein, partial [Planctomycetota bacterium]|nr:glycosyltransferase family 4 protein [Planctomycetota bacterium]